MASGRYEAEITISSAKNLKNVNWRHGDLKPYAVLWIDPAAKCSTRVDDSGDEDPTWNETLKIPVPFPIEDATLHVDVVHAGAAEGTKPLVGSAKLPLREVLDDAGIGARFSKTLKLKRPSGRPQGKLEVAVTLRQPQYRAPDPYYAPPYGYGVPPGAAPRDYPGPPQGYPAAYGGYGGPPDPYRSAPPSGYPEAYGARTPVAVPYGQDGYGQQASTAAGQEKKKGGKFGMGTGLAVGAAAGLLGGLAIGEGVDYVEDKITDHVAEKVEDDLGYGDDDGF